MKLYEAVIRIMSIVIITVFSNSLLAQNENPLNKISIASPNAATLGK